MYVLRYTIVTFAFSEVPDRYYYRTASVGQTVKLSCPTKLDRDVNWVYLATRGPRAKTIYFGNHGMYRHWHDGRFTVLDQNHSYSLVIDNVTVDDSAYYRCEEDVGQGNRHFYGLTVEGILYITHSDVSRRKSFPLVFTHTPIQHLHYHEAHLSSHPYSFAIDSAV